MAFRGILAAASLCGACATTGGSSAPERFAVDAVGHYDNSAQVQYAPTGLVAFRRLELDGDADPSSLRATWRDRADGPPSETLNWRFGADASGSPTLDLGGARPLRLERTGKGAWDARVDAEDCPLEGRRAYQARVTLTPTAILYEQRILAADGADPTPSPPLDLRRIP